MPTTVAEVQRVVEQLWPASGAESWDAVGLCVGEPGATVRRILLAVDAVPAVAQEAVDSGADLLLTHHPLLLRGVNSVAADGYKGAVITALIRGHCALLTAHTNADVVDAGTSGTLASALQLTDVHPLLPGPDGSSGLGRVGYLTEPMTLGRLARLVASILPPTAQGIRVAGQFDRPVSRIAICGGSGDSFLALPTVLEADAYITSDLRHHPASEAIENATIAGGPALIDVSHWASEWLWLDSAAQSLSVMLPEVDIEVSELRTDPWDFVVVQ